LIPEENLGLSETLGLLQSCHCLPI